jgi:hypothetical protein
MLLGDFCAKGVLAADRWVTNPTIPSNRLGRPREMKNNNAGISDVINGSTQARVEGRTLRPHCNHGRRNPQAEAVQGGKQCEADEERGALPSENGKGSGHHADSGEGRA